MAEDAKEMGEGSKYREDPKVRATCPVLLKFFFFFFFFKIFIYMYIYIYVQPY